MFILELLQLAQRILINEVNVKANENVSLSYNFFFVNPSFFSIWVIFFPFQTNNFKSRIVDKAKLSLSKV